MRPHRKSAVSREYPGAHREATLPQSRIVANRKLPRNGLQVPEVDLWPLWLCVVQLPSSSSLVNDVRNILRSDERYGMSGRPVRLSARRDITRCVEPSLVVRARRATPVAGTL